MNIQRDMYKDPFSQRILETDLKNGYVFMNKTKVLDIFNTDQNCFIKNNIESTPQEIWIRIRFLEINGSTSLLVTLGNFALWR